MLCRVAKVFAASGALATAAPTGTSPISSVGEIPFSVMIIAIVQPAYLYSGLSVGTG